MPLDPDYGSTRLTAEEEDALTPVARAIVGDPPSKAAIYDLEQAIEVDVQAELLVDVLEGKLVLDQLLSTQFLRDLHTQLYGDLWLWAGAPRQRLLNIGVDPEHIVVELHNAFGTLLYRYEHTDDWSPREFGIAVHADLVRIHPFTDGNGRSSRLLGELAFVAAQLGVSAEPAEALVELYDWDLDKNAYVALLRRYDQNRDPKELAAFIRTVPLPQ